MGNRGMGEASAWAKAVAKAVSELRAREGLTVQGLADRIDKDPSYLYSRLNGSAPFNENDVELLARAFGVHPLDVFRLAAQLSDADDMFEPTVQTDPSELGRRLTLIGGSPRPSGEDFVLAHMIALASERELGLTPERWAQLRDGQSGSRVRVRVLELTADYAGVDAQYLTDLGNEEVTENTEAQLDLRCAIREVGGESVLARSVGDVGPAALRAIAASLRAARDGQPG